MATRPVRLSSEDQLHYAVAQGFVGLGMYLDADAALDDICRSSRRLPEVLAVSLDIYRGLGKWNLMQTVAKTLAQQEPANVAWWISWAYATRKAESIEAARLILLKALRQDLDHSVIHYNLACYDCQLGDVDSARNCLTECLDIDPGWRLKAFEDDDLALLWDSL